jgi:acetoin utilization protein AcuB
MAVLATGVKAAVAQALTLPEGECMQVKDYMQATPMAVTPEDLVSTASQRMRGVRIRHLPVVTAENVLVGVVTDRDIRQAGASDAPHMAEHELHYLLERLTVKDIMTTQVITVHRDTPLDKAGRIFLEKKFGCLPVVHNNNVLEGIITVADLLRAYVQQHETVSSSS